MAWNHWVLRFVSIGCIYPTQSDLHMSHVDRSAFERCQTALITKENYDIKCLTDIKLAPLLPDFI